MKFNEIVKNESIIKAIDKMGFEEMMPIQEKAIPFVYEKKDVIGHAKTGTGKTAAFAIPILEFVKPKTKSIQGLILVPTRELAKQVADEIKRLAYYQKGISICEIYGGISYTKQKAELKAQPTIIVATPGRLIDLLERNYLTLDSISHLVLDEADEMLSIGFQKELETIVTYLNDDRQTMLFSATFNKNVEKIAKQYLTNPTKISVVDEDKVANSIEQKYLCVNNNEKQATLLKLLKLHHNQLIMVFANTKKEVDLLVSYLQENKIMAEAIHGDLVQKMRENVLKKFKDGIVQVLVCSDVAARGLDIKGVDVIINVDIPYEKEYYVHRVGRTGRANSTGIAYTLISGNKERRIKQLAKELKTNIEKMKPITNKDIKKIEQKAILTEIEDAIVNNQDDQLERIKPLLKKGYDLDSIFNGLLNYVFKENDIETNDNESARLFVNLGSKDKFSKRDLVKLFNVKNEKLKDIEVMQNFAFCTLENVNVEQKIKELNKKKFNKKRVKVEYANN
ncbi:DEAD/DEAH box helicase [Erysipelotrichaceae bacterium OttesenSCG-928-M19]|nr:DEAD/DEAH box helicase [Erysipelotrichaceae bacterium OttesenSCG-928-M19]